MIFQEKWSWRKGQHGWLGVPGRRNISYKYLEIRGKMAHLGNYKDSDMPGRECTDSKNG